MVQPFVYRQRVRWVDTDASGIIHFTAAFRFAEAAEVEWFREVGLSAALLTGAHGLNLPRVHAAADFRRPLRFDDPLAVTVRPGRLGRTSLTLHHEIRREEEDPTAPPAVSVEVVLVATDLSAGRAVPWPEAVRRTLLAAGAAPG